MKKILTCNICGKPYRENKMYQVEIREIVTVVAGVFREIPPRIVKICPKCNYEAGYKSHKKEK